MRTPHDNIKSLPPSDIIISQDQIRINPSRNIIEFRSFLYCEIKRQSTHPVTIEEIDKFIDSPAGQKGLATFLKHRYQPKETARPKSIGESLKSQLQSTTIQSLPIFLGAVL